MVHPNARNILKNNVLTGYNAMGYDEFGNVNLSWTPVWGTTDSLGTPAQYGGSAATGYLANYTAGAVPGWLVPTMK